MITLNSTHFSGQYLKAFNNDVVMLLYKAEWCGYCTKIKPEYNKLSKLLEHKVIVAQIDIDENKDLIAQNNKFLFGYKVNQFPTIVIYKNGYFVDEYTGQRTAEAMKEELSKYL